MGYGTFLKTFSKDADPLIEALSRDVSALGKGLSEASERLTQIQHALIELLKMLDPDYVRFPEDRRSKA
jgi:hypothetical protein